MAVIADSLVSLRDPRFQSLSGYTLKPSEKSLVICRPSSLSLGPIRQRKAGVASYSSKIVVKSAYRTSLQAFNILHLALCNANMQCRDGGRPSSAGIFIGGFVLGGIMVGTLACVYASEISKALTGTNKRELLKKLPKFIYDEEKALERNRKILTEKIAQINAALDDVSSQLVSKPKKSSYAPKRAAASPEPDQAEAAM